MPLRIASRGDPRPGRTAWWWPALATLAVTLVQLGRPQPWRDELATWSAATRDLPDLLRMARTVDASATPYYLFMHGWTGLFGDSPTALRLPSALAMTAAAALAAVLGGRLLGPGTGLLAGLLFAVVPSTSRYGQEARPYALVTMLAVLATLLLVRAIDRPGWWRWLAYGLAVAGLGLGHLVAATLLAGHAVAVLLALRRTRDRRLLRWPVALLPAVAAVTPLVLLGGGQHQRQLDWVGRPGLGELVRFPGGVTGAAAVGGALAVLAALGLATLLQRAGTADGAARPDPAGADSDAGTGDPGGPAAAHPGRIGRRGWAVVLGACVLLPVAVLFVAGLVTPLWVPRYLVFTVPFAGLLAGAALAAVDVRAALPVVAVVAVLGGPEQAGMRRTHEWPRTRPVDYAAAARIIDAGDRSGDAVVYSPRDGWRFLDLALAYHLRDGRPDDLLAVRDPVRAGSLWADECADPAPCLAPAGRVWLLLSGEHGADPLAAVPEPKAGALRAGFTVDHTWTVDGLTVALLSPTPR
ncbi:glycosyltransferase family 39 protein [Polymorphospora sp. 2-325]|uniref:Glycosyltransferase family 39 protein n=1 Tax=Polymorphospora lycopeni TaxID=3140240 RepID=A0ABV5CUR2_9ACTN